jgi:hypothetical protein
MTSILDIGNLVVIVLNIGAPDENRYGYAEALKSCSNDELVERINREVGVPHWVTSRADYLAHLYVEVLTRDLDCSSFIQGNTMSIAKRLRLVGRTIEIQVS